MRHVPWVVLVLGGAACDDTLFGFEADGTGGTTPEVTGYAGVVALADQHCVVCHGSSNHEVSGFGLDLETNFHAATVNVPSGYVPFTIVVPSEPADSLLYLKMKGTNPSGTGALMPLTGPLGEGSIAVFEEWILDGAPTE